MNLFILLPLILVCHLLVFYIIGFQNFKKNGYNVVDKKRERKYKSMTKPKKNDKVLSEKDKIKQLEEENLS